MAGIELSMESSVNDGSRWTISKHGLYYVDRAEISICQLDMYPIPQFNTPRERAVVIALLEQITEELYVQGAEIKDGNRGVLPRL